jgi:hypothetical protein
LTRTDWLRRRLLHGVALAGLGGPAMAMRPEEPSARAGMIDVRQFGAKGDGKTDDAPAINRAIQALRERPMRAGKFAFVPRLSFRGGIYAVDSPINLTRLQALNAVIAGDGAVILGRCKDQPVIDALGSRWLTISDLTIVGDQEATPKLGLQIGRLADGRVADNHRLVNVKVVGHYALACLLNLAAETTGFDHVFCWNDRPDPDSYCLIQDGLDHFRTVSSFMPDQHAEPERDTSFNENEFINCDFRHAGGGVPVWLGDTARHRFYRCYAATKGSACFVLYCGPNGHTMLDVDCHCETRGLEHVFQVTGGGERTVIHGFSYKDHGIFATRAVFARKEPIRHVVLQHARIEMGHFFEPGCRVLDEPTGWTITGEVYLAEPKFWNNNEQFSGILYLDNEVHTVKLRPHT